MTVDQTFNRHADTDTKAYLTALRQTLFQGDILDDYPSRLINATDNSIYQVLPKAVIAPLTHDDIDIALSLAAEDRFQAIQFTPRGGGTGTNGQSLNNTIILDTSKYLNNIIDFDADAMQVVVEPGVVLDQLNAFLKTKGFFFPPTVSTSSRATLGGMVGTDASGKGSRVYGKTSDYIEAMDVVLSDGTPWTARKIPVDDINSLTDDDLKSIALKQVVQSITDHREEIEKVFPRMNRGLTGYNLKQAINDNIFNPGYLLAGSEGSLCVTKTITFRVLPLPKRKGLVTIRYASFNDALEDVGLLLQADPAAIETVDDKIMSMAKDDIIWQAVGHILGESKNEPPVMAMNFVEFTGDTDDDITRQINRLEDLLKGGNSLATGWRGTATPDDIAALWEMRKKSVGLLGALQGKRRAAPFVEDTAVPPENLAAYIREFRDLLDGHGVDYGMFGHVDVGCLHVRPTLDLFDEMDEGKVREISDGVVALTKKYGGLLWGEHGKGFRGEYSPEFFGPRLYTELKKIKRAFDPAGKLNPGKITTPFGLDNSLTRIDEVPLRAHFDKTISSDHRLTYEKAVHCNGNGACFNWNEADPMCPSYKATRDRVQSPKGRAGLLREWLRLQDKGEIDGVTDDFSKQVFAALETCLGCKTCISQCPVKVDIPNMKSRFLERFHQKNKRPLKDHVIAAMESLTPMTSKMPGLVNFIQSLPPVVWLAENLLGMTDLPRLSTRTVLQGLKERNAPPLTPEAISKADKPVIIIQDCFTTHYDAPAVLAHYDLLTKLGYSVFIAPYRANGKPLHVKGMLKKFDETAQQNDKYLGEIATYGAPLVGIEASITLTYRHEYDQRLQDRPAYRVQMVQEWLADEIISGRLVPAQKYDGTFKLFTHCMEKTQIPATAKNWQTIFASFGLNLDPVDTGCCGMSGVFGHETQNIAISKRLFDLSWRDPLKDAGADKAMATGFSCRCQSKRFGDFRSPHPVEVLNKQLNQGKE